MLVQARHGTNMENGVVADVEQRQQSTKVVAEEIEGRLVLLGNLRPLGNALHRHG